MRLKNSINLNNTKYFDAIEVQWSSQEYKEGDPFIVHKCPILIMQDKYKKKYFLNK